MSNINGKVISALHSGCVILEWPRRMGRNAPQRSANRRDAEMCEAPERDRGWYWPHA